MDHYLYKCQYCGKEFRPSKRYIQKFCSTSCKSNSFNRNKKNQSVLIPKTVIEKEKLKIEKMSLQGVGNAAVGTLAVNALTSIFTKEANKPATKGDMKDLLANLKQRYQPVKNLGIRPDGLKPFYDSHTQTIVYLNKSF